MNFYEQQLKRIKIVLGMEKDEVKLAEAVLDDNVTVVRAESFEPGMKIFVVSESGEEAPAPEGVHVTEDGIRVEVDSEGTIVTVEKPEPAAEEVEVEAAEEKMEVTEEIVETIIEKKIEEMMGAVMMVVEEVAKEVSTIKEEMASYKSKMEKMSKTPGATKTSTFNQNASAEEPASQFQVQMEKLNVLRAAAASKKRK